MVIRFIGRIQFCAKCTLKIQIHFTSTFKNGLTTFKMISFLKYHGSFMLLVNSKKMYYINYETCAKVYKFHNMHGSTKFCQRGSNFNKAFLFVVFLVDKGRKDPNTTISGSSWARQRNALLTCLFWPNIECWLNSFVIVQEIRTSIAFKLYIL